jgi:Protein of unknown function with HXXEE motif
MSHAWVLWIVTSASALHVVEEYGFGWQGWAVATFGPKFGVWVSTTAFWVTNAAMIVVAVGASAVGWQAPGFSLGLPALLIVDALWGHIWPTIQARRPNPGFFSAMILYLPLGVWAYLAAGEDHVLSPATVLLSAAVGAALLFQALIIPRFGPRLRYADVAIPDVRRAESLTPAEVLGN